MRPMMGVAMSDSPTIAAAKCANLADAIQGICEGQDLDVVIATLLGCLAVAVASSDRQQELTDAIRAGFPLLVPWMAHKFDVEH
jgi:hypothetical protein